MCRKQTGGWESTYHCFHVNDCKTSHLSTKVVDDTTEWLRDEYEVIFEDGTGVMKVY